MDIENMVEFETANRPLASGTDFPYRKIIDSMLALHATKSLVFDVDKLPYTRIVALRKYAKAEGLGYVKYARKEARMHIWIHGGTA